MNHRELTMNDFTFDSDAACLSCQDRCWSYLLTMTSDVNEIFGSLLKTAKTHGGVSIYASLSERLDSVADTLILLLYRNDGSYVDCLRYLLSEDEKYAILIHVIEYEKVRLQKIIEEKCKALGIPHPKNGGSK